MNDSRGSVAWPAKDIVYIAIVGPVLLTAFAEWFLFLAAFLYCLAKTYQKGDHWSIKVLSVVFMVIFTASRLVFVPVMMVTLPLPTQATSHFPEKLVKDLQWLAFWIFAALLTLPWLFCVHILVTNSIGRKKRTKEVLNDRTAPKTVIVMPVYKEAPDVLMKAIDSVVNSDYPSCCIHIFLSWDGETIDESYLQVIYQLGVPVSTEQFPQSIDVTYKGARITVSRFHHGGKRFCQKQTFRLIDKVYADYLKKRDNLFMLFIDSDCILDKLALQNFIYDMELKPGSKHNMLAMTGIITSTTEKNSFLTVLQDMEYIHGQLFERAVESGCGAVTCLPGALTMLRFSAFRKMAKYYFTEKAEQCDDLFDYAKCHLGEDRWLTHLLMIGAQERYQIQMCASAFCKTEAVQTFRSLLKQRRRWFLGYITNEVCMLTDVRLWTRYPLLCVVRFLQNSLRTTTLLFFVMVISLITTSKKVNELPVGFIGISLGLNYVLMFYFGAKLKRYKAWLYPLMFLLNPFFNWLYMIYGIFTSGQRTWGGPRADAAKADEHTTPQQAVAQARAQGDELNVQVSTFRPRPHEKEGSEGIMARSMSPFPPTPPLDLHPYCSWGSANTWDSGSITLPQNVENLVKEQGPPKPPPARAEHESTAMQSRGRRNEASAPPAPPSSHYSEDSWESSTRNPPPMSSEPHQQSKRNGSSASSHPYWNQPEELWSAGTQHQTPMPRDSPARGHWHETSAPPHQQQHPYYRPNPLSGTASPPSAWLRPSPTRGPWSEGSAAPLQASHYETPDPWARGTPTRPPLTRRMAMDNDGRYPSPARGRSPAARGAMGYMSETGTGTPRGSFYGPQGVK